MKKKLTKFGNSLALIIDKPILALLGITDETELEMRTDGTRLTLEPIRGAGKVSDDPEVQRSYGKIVSKYAAALKKLA